MKNIFGAFIAMLMWSTTSAQSENVDSFLMPPGTIIHASRDSGFRYLSSLARRKEKELAMAYLPVQKVWITISLEREATSVVLDTAMLAVVTDTVSEIEIWHTHPSIEKKNSLENVGWMMPSLVDLCKHFLHYLDKKNEAKVTDIVATEYGATHFWWNTLSMQKAMELATKYSALEIIVDRILLESERLRVIVRGKSLTELSDVLENLNGIFRYSFEPLQQ